MSWNKALDKANTFVNRDQIQGQDNLVIWSIGFVHFMGIL